MDRRHFCRLLFWGSVSMLLPACRLVAPEEEPPPEAVEEPDNLLTEEAMFYQKLNDDRVRCNLCFHACTLAPGERGFCRNRQNEEGMLYTLVYGRPSAVHVEPVEKLPLKHFRPGSERLNIGTASCNLRCKYCHNWHLSQASIEEVRDYQKLSPEDVVQRATERDAPSISFTYNEPTVFYEYMYDIARLAREEGMEVLLNSNGAMQREPLLALLPYIDAVNIDLKGFTEDFYREMAGGSLEPVLDTLKTVRAEGVWLEVVNLVVPGYNDDMDTVAEMCRWIIDELGEETPVHFNRFTPAYRLTDESMTPLSTLEEAHQVALAEGLHFVTIGNVPEHPYESTYCPHCGEVLIERAHYDIRALNVQDGKCKFCDAPIAGVWD